MIPITQTKVVVRNSQGDIVVHGNCYAAAIASILEVPITEVPNVETLFNVDGMLWWRVMDKFLTSKGWDLSTDDRFKIFHISEFGTKQDREQWREYCQDKYYFVSGESARGVGHICIFKNGELVHDPHPTREGILTFETFQELIPISA